MTAPKGALFGIYLPPVRGFAAAVDRLALFGFISADPVKILLN
jgi:hypothetical protein